MKDAMFAAINNAIAFEKSIKIQMDVTKDWNQYSVVIAPEYVASMGDYIVIHTTIGTIYIDTMDVEYDVEDGCYICNGINSTTVVFC